MNSRKSCRHILSRLSGPSTQLQIKELSCQGHQKGVALILIVFIIALASIIVLNLAYSTFIGSRLNLAAERSLQAEYLLKSALNFAVVLIRADTSSEDSPDDLWYVFRNGVSIPAEWLELNEPNLTVQLEIRAEGAKLPIRELVPTQGAPSPKWLPIFTRLFKDILQFDKDEEEDRSGLCPQPNCSPEQMIANLIDYIDADNEPFDDGPYKGIEKEGLFPNKRLLRTEELASVPGFTPGRVQRLLPLISAAMFSQVNINSAPREVLLAIDSDLTDQNVEDIRAFREDKERGPFRTDSLQSQMSVIGIDQDIVTRIVSLLTERSDLFQVVAKVDYATSKYFLRALVRRDPTPGAMPYVISMELF